MISQAKEITVGVLAYKIIAKSQASTLAETALMIKHNALLSKIDALDVNSKTFESDLALIVW
jgi:hypothetical protein